MEKLPSDFRKVLAANAKAYTQWNSLSSIAKRDFSTWIEGAKQQETRVRRIKKAVDVLAKGKRRPCCYSVVPMNLYKALSESPKAKASWSRLTPDARRDFSDWVNSAKESDLLAKRIEKTIITLIAGKRHL